VGCGEGTPHAVPISLLPEVMENLVPPLIAQTSSGTVPHNSLLYNLNSRFEVDTLVISPNHEGIRPVKVLSFAFHFLIEVI